MIISCYNRKMARIANIEIYLERLSKPLQEKLRVAHYIPPHAKQVVDVGCADGVVTLTLARLFPNTQFFGIDLDEGFIKKAQDAAQKESVKNVSFEKIYLRDLLARHERYDAVTFISVLHEFYTYGEGISSVLKALADAHELLRPNGKIVIRDMILHEYTKHTNFRVQEIVEKVRARPGMKRLIDDCERAFGPIQTLYELNHFLLKYFYPENWERERKENYVPVTFEQYGQIFLLLGMDLQLQDSYTIPYLRNKWKKDFGLQDEDIENFRSTGFIVGQKL